MIAATASIVDISFVCVQCLSTVDPCDSNKSRSVCLAMSQFGNETVPEIPSPGRGFQKGSALRMG